MSAYKRRTTYDAVASLIVMHTEKDTMLYAEGQAIGHGDERAKKGDSTMIIIANGVRSVGYCFRQLRQEIGKEFQVYVGNCVMQCLGGVCDPVIIVDCLPIAMGRLSIAVTTPHLRLASFVVHFRSAANLFAHLPPPS